MNVFDVYTQRLPFFYYFSTDWLAVILRYPAEVYMPCLDIDIIVWWVDILSFIGLLMASISHVM